MGEKTAVKKEGGRERRLGEKREKREKKQRESGKGEEWKEQ